MPVVDEKGQNSIGLSASRGKSLPERVTIEPPVR